MPRIRCHYTDCVFIDDGYCSAAAVEIDPDTGCGTYSPNEEAGQDEDWEDELEEWEDDETEDEDEEWLDEDEDEI
jgi:hypothetical protein